MYKKLKRVWVDEPRQRHRELMKMLAKIHGELEASGRNHELARLAVSLPVVDDVQRFLDSRQLTMLETLERIRREELSFARFGDGELQMMFRPDFKLAFQRNSAQLQSALHAVLADARGTRCLVGLPYLFKDRWQSRMWLNVWPRLAGVVDHEATFGNSHVSRPLFFQFAREEGVEAWRKVWDGKKVVIVTGRGSRFELVDGLFDNVADARFVHSAPVDAFEDYERTRDGALDQSADLFLIALGPAGTVLAHDLASRGRRALDVGHISDSYLNVFEGRSRPERKSLQR